MPNSDYKYSALIAFILTLGVIYAAWKITIFILVIWFILLFLFFNKTLFMKLYKPNKENMSPFLNTLFGEQNKETQTETLTEKEGNSIDAGSSSDGGGGCDS